MSEACVAGICDKSKDLFFYLKLHLCTYFGLAISYASNHNVRIGLFLIIVRPCATNADKRHASDGISNHGKDVLQFYMY